MVLPELTRALAEWPRRGNAAAQDGILSFELLELVGWQPTGVSVRLAPSQGWRRLGTHFDREMRNSHAPARVSERRRAFASVPP